jgi:hypothetical protein
MKTKREIERLIRALDHPKTGEQARQALVDLGPPAIPLLIKALGDRKVSLAAARALSDMGLAAVEPLVIALEDKRVSAYAAIALEDIGPPAVEVLIKALKSKDRRARLLTIRALGHIGDKRAVGSLTSALNEAALLDHKGTLLAAAVEALKKLGQPVEKEGDTTREEFFQGLEERGFALSPRSNRLHYHPQLADVRFRIRKRVVALEKRERTGKKSQWRLARSFSIARELHLALRAVDSLMV